MMKREGLLFDRAELEDAVERDEFVAWKKQRYLQFRKTMRDTQFPCHYAIQAERTDSARYLFAGDVRKRDALRRVRDGLRQYLEQYQSIAERTTLVVFFEPSGEDDGEREYRDRFWSVLEFLNEHDPEPWPGDVPEDPDDPEWEFCFSGEPMFIVGRAPFYTDRKSRYTPYGLEISIQPRRTLDDISGDTLEGQQARSMIRDRLEDYDDIAPHSDIGDYGDPDTREWKQYLLPSSNDESLREFPFDIDVK